MRHCLQHCLHSGLPPLLQSFDAVVNWRGASRTKKKRRRRRKCMMHFISEMRHWLVFRKCMIPFFKMECVSKGIHCLSLTGWCENEQTLYIRLGVAKLGVSVLLIDLSQCVSQLLLLLWWFLPAVYIHHFYYYYAAVLQATVERTNIEANTQANPTWLRSKQTSDWGSKVVHPKVKPSCFLLILSGHLTNRLTLNRQANWIR